MPNPNWKEDAVTELQAARKSLANAGGYLAMAPLGDPARSSAIEIEDVLENVERLVDTLIFQAKTKLQ